MRGRPTDNPLTKSVLIRMSPDQKARLLKLGGSAWVRGQIEKASGEKKAQEGES